MSRTRGHWQANGWVPAQQIMWAKVPELLDQGMEAEHDLDWNAVVAANPELADSEFQKRVGKWNALKDAADHMRLDDDAAVQFIAYGMTGGAEGALPANVSKDALNEAIAKAVGRDHSPKPV